MKKIRAIKTVRTPISFIHLRVKSIFHAGEGICSFFSSQPNALIHLFTTIVVVILALMYPVKKAEIIALVIVTACVWMAELFNTAVEVLSDIVSPAIDPRIKYVKDIAAAAVLVGAIAAVATGLIIFIPKIFA